MCLMHTTFRSCSLVRRRCAVSPKLPKCRESATNSTIPLRHGLGALLWTLVVEILLISAVNKHCCMYHYFHKKNGRAQHIQISLGVKGITTTIWLISCKWMRKLHKFTQVLLGGVFCVSGKFKYKRWVEVQTLEAVLCHPLIDLYVEIQYLLLYRKNNVHKAHLLHNFCNLEKVQPWQDSAKNFAFDIL